MIRLLVLIILFAPGMAAAGEVELGYKVNDHIVRERAGHIGIKYGHQGFSLNMEYDRGELDGETTTHDGSITLNYGHRFTDKWSIWVDESAGFDKPAGVEFENRLGAGPKYVFIETETAKISLSVGYLSHYQRLQDAVSATERWSWRLKVHYRWAEAVLFHQPAVYTPEDFINKGVLAIEAALDGPWALRYRIEQEYRSLENRRKSLQALNLVYRFGKE